MTYATLTLVSSHELDMSQHHSNLWLRAEDAKLDLNMDQDGLNKFCDEQGIVSVEALMASESVAILNAICKLRGYEAVSLTKLRERRGSSDVCTTTFLLVKRQV